MANRRLEIMMAVASLRVMGGSLPDLAWNLFSPPCTVLGGRRVRRVDPPARGLRAVWIDGIERPVFLPEQFDLHCIHHVLSEETYPRHWHFYATPETPVEKDDVVLDCGAAEGLFTLLARGRGAQSVAFEPHPLYFRALQRTFADDPQVRLVAAAVGDAPGQAFLSDGDVAAHVLSDGGVPIAIDTIDAVCDRMKLTPTYLKADIEGFEAKMLAGAAETIARHHPKIAMTTYHDENDARELAATLRRYWSGYRIRTKGICNRQGKPVMLHAW
jgi:FkbM family methyltransferase